MRSLIKLAVLAATSLTAAGAQAQLVAPANVEVLGAIRTIEPGEIISEKDLGTVEAAPIQARVAAEIDQLLGKEAKRRLEAGKPIRSYDVMEPQLVKKGQKVSLVVKKGNMTISATGKALTAGAAGEVVRVQNAQTYALLEGEVAGTGIVRIDPSAR